MEYSSHFRLPGQGGIALAVNDPSVDKTIPPFCLTFPFTASETFPNCSWWRLLPEAANHIWVQDWTLTFYHLDKAWKGACLSFPSTWSLHSYTLPILNCVSDPSIWSPQNFCPEEEDKCRDRGRCESTGRDQWGIWKMSTYICGREAAGMSPHQSALWLPIILIIANVYRLTTTCRKVCLPCARWSLTHRSHPFLTTPWAGS